MPTKAEIVNQIEEQIIPNLMEMITGGILQNVLLGMVDQINTLVGELDDLNTDDRSSIVNAINELVFNIQAIEDNLTPYVYFGLDDPNIVTPVGFGGDIPSFYVQQEHVGFDVVNVGFWTYTGIFGKEWVDLSLSSGGGIQSVQAGTNINVDNTDPENPIVSAIVKEEFIELNDTPSSYTGNSRKKVRVNAGENALIFFDDYETIRMVLTPDGEDAETGDKVGFYVDGDWEIVSAHATAQTAPTGSAITINIKKNGSSITSTPITIPNGSNTSLSSSGAVFSSTSVTTGDLLVPSIASVGSTIKGQNLQLIFKYIRK